MAAASGTFIVAVLACGVCCAGVANPAGAVAAPNAPGRAEATRRTGLPGRAGYRAPSLLGLRTAAHL